MIIKNADAIGVTELRRKALKIAEAGFAALDLSALLKKSLKLEENDLILGSRRFPLSKTGKLLFVGVGKCSGQAALAVEEILGERLAAGVALNVSDSPAPKRIRLYKGDHPYPSERNVLLTSEILALLRGLSAEDFVIFLISGGGTVLLCQPKNHKPEEEREMVKALFRAGAEIGEMNTVRKHLSLARGGFLAKAAYPARGLSLVISDVPGNDIGTVASGPTVQDRTRVADALVVVKKYGLDRNSNFNPDYFLETPKEEKYFENIENILFLSNETALAAMAAEAKRQGFAAVIKTGRLSGEAREVGRQIVAVLRAKPPESAALWGGETTVTIKGNGKGGRNQELALGALSEIRDNELILALASDGVDNGEAAGAICDKLTRERARQLGLPPEEFLKNNDSFSFFEKTASQIITGPTGANVADLIVAVKS